MSMVPIGITKKELKVFTYDFIKNFMTIIASKNMDDAIELSSYILKQVKSLENKLKKQAEAYGDKISFIGAKTHAELKEIYPSADVFVMSSVTTQDGAKEGFGLVMLEAMASGLPVVAFNSGGIAQLIEDDINGLLCEEKDVKALSSNIQKALYDDATRKRLIENGNRTVKEYDYKEIAGKYSKIYLDAIDKWRKP